MHFLNVMTVIGKTRTFVPIFYETDMPNVRIHQEIGQEHIPQINCLTIL